MRATMNGCEIVCFAPIGSAPAPYAFAATTAGTKRWRGTSRMAWSTRSSRTPRFRTSSTMRARRCVRSGKQLLERPQPRDRLMVREVEVQRRDGDVAVLHGLEVCALVVVPRRRTAADPVVRPPARIEPLDHALGVDA